MRHILEAHIKAGIRYATSALQQLIGCAQATICQPAFWRQFAHFLEVALESRETSTRSLRKLCHGHIAPEILLHEFMQVNLPRRSSILKRVKHKFVSLIFVNTLFFSKQGRLITLRCKDNSFKHNTICFAGQNAFSLTFSTEKVIIRGFLQHLAKKKRSKVYLKQFFHYLCGEIS